MQTKDNIQLGKLYEANLICIYVDVRDSIKINEKNEKNILLNFYAEMSNKSYDIFHKNGFQNIEIQGDGIYGLFDLEKHHQYFESVSKCIRELSDHIINLYKWYGIKCTISINKGIEYYSAFGYSKNELKQISFFGNVVSKTKKMNSLSRNAMIVISKKTFSNNEICKLIKMKPTKNLYLMFGKRIGKVSLYKWK